MSGQRKTSNCIANQKWEARTSLEPLDQVSRNLLDRWFDFLLRQSFRVVKPAEASEPAKSFANTSLGTSREKSSPASAQAKFCTPYHQTSDTFLRPTLITYLTMEKLKLPVLSAPNRRSHIGSNCSVPRAVVMSPKSITCSPFHPNHSVK